MPAVNTSEIYEESFKMDKLTSYGLVDEKITTIKNYEDNLNTNPTNKQHLEAFIRQAIEAKKMFKAYFNNGEFKDPGEDVHKEPVVVINKDETDEEKTKTENATTKKAEETKKAAEQKEADQKTLA
jgi:hypothetical protein